MRPGELHTTLALLLDAGLARDGWETLHFTYLVGWATLILIRASGARGGINSPGLDLDLQLGLVLAVLHGMNYIIAYWLLFISSPPCRFCMCREQS